MTDFLKASDVKKEFGIDRSSLLRWEEAGHINPHKTPKGHRRYTRGDIQGLIQKSPTPNLGQSNRPNNYNEIGVTGLTRFGGQVVEERTRALQGRRGRQVFREMRVDDPVISALFFALNQSLAQARRRIIPCSERSEDKAVAEFIEQCLNDMSWSFADQFNFICDPMFEQGFSFLEVVYKRRNGRYPLPQDGQIPPTSQYSDGRIGWRKWSPRPAETIADGLGWDIDDNGGIKGLYQQALYGDDTSLRYIPIQKALLFRTTPHPANNPEGIPIHRPAYKPWYFTVNYEEIEGIAIERNTQGVPVIYLGDGTTMGADPNSDYSVSKELVQNLRWDEQAGIVFPHPKLGTAGQGRGVLLEFASANTNSQWDVNAIIERLDKRKAIVVLAQWIMLGMESVGSFALMQGQGDMFSLGVRGWAMKIAEVINRHAIPKLVDLNYFPGKTGYPEIQFGPIGVPNLKDLADAVNGLVEKEVITPDPELERHLRQQMNLPEPQPQEIKEGDTADLKDDLKELRETSIAYQRAVRMGIISEQLVTELMAPLINRIKEKTIGKTEEAPTGEAEEQPRVTNQTGELAAKLSQQHERDIEAGVLTVRVARQQYLDGEIITQKQFNTLELEDGRLPNGESVLGLFELDSYSDLLDLGVLDPTLILENDPAQMVGEISYALAEVRERLLSEQSPEQNKRLTYALAALKALSSQYEDLLVQEVGAEKEEELTSDE